MPEPDSRIGRHDFRKARLNAFRLNQGARHGDY
jgi:hypothetical protein